MNDMALLGGFILAMAVSLIAAAEFLVREITK